MHESKFPFVSRIELIRSKLLNFSAHVYGVNARVRLPPTNTGGGGGAGSHPSTKCHDPAPFRRRLALLIFRRALLAFSAIFVRDNLSVDLHRLPDIFYSLSFFVGGDLKVYPLYPIVLVFLAPSSRGTTFHSC